MCPHFYSRYNARSSLRARLHASQMVTVNDTAKQIAKREPDLATGTVSSLCRRRRSLTPLVISEARVGISSLAYKTPSRLRAEVI
ncbi:unnamed protein product, partial [Iphiclides podalirius]